MINGSGSVQEILNQCLGNFSLGADILFYKIFLDADIQGMFINSKCC